MRSFFCFFVFSFCLSGYCSLDEYILENNLVITEGHIGKLCHRTFFKDLFEKNPWIEFVAETGFNAGHSAEIFLLAKPQTFVTSFDIGHHDYVQKGYEYLQKTFPGRLELVLGDSKESVPWYASQHPGKTFDLIFIDGGHDIETAFFDIINMKACAHEKTLLVLDDLNISPAIAWNTAIKRGIIKELETFAPPDSPKWGLAKYIFQ